MQTFIGGPHYLCLLIIFLITCSCESMGDSDMKTTKPNVLLIFTDQQHVNMMSAAGNQHLQTPNMDRLARRGVLFKQSYCTSPVCAPARSSIITGRMPHETGVQWNGDTIKEGIINIGEIFRSQGYQTYWGGKWHLPESYPQRPQARQKEIKGFDLLQYTVPNPENWMLGAETDPPLTEAAITFLNEYESNKPFFLAVSYHNPHDICFYARKEGWVTDDDSLLNIRYYNFEYKLPEVVASHPSAFDSLPPLPDNHPIEKGEPEFISDKRKYHQEYGLETHLAHKEFREQEWRGYLNAYHKLTEMVDLEIGRVIDALEQNGLADNTIILFTSDHGDGASAHQWAAKLSLYQEPATVPFIISYPGHIDANRIDQHNVVSQIDIVPTLCDYAGIETEWTFTGKSIRSILENPNSEWRKYIVEELADFKPDRSRKGRMVRTDQYKYNVYSSGRRNEQLFDLKNDPGETTNLVYQPEFEEIRDLHRRYLHDWMERTADDFVLPP